jgi:hypothetical protein
VNAEVVSCSLYEPDGTLLTAGMARVQPAGTEIEAVIVALDRPGRLVQLCLLGSLRELRLKLGMAAPVPARVERIAFDPQLGRTCTVHMDAA